MHIEEHHPLKKHNTFGIDVKARYFAQVNSTQLLMKLLGHGVFRENEHLVLGDGSNILFTGDFDGLVVQMAIDGIHVVKEDDDYFWVKAGAGVSWHHLVTCCIKAGFGGLENLALIPGKVGAAPIQNIGAYGVEVKDYIEGVEAFEITTGKKRYFTNAECRFAYRDSIFKNTSKNQYIITNVAFRLTKKHTLHTSYGAIEETLADMKIDRPTIASVGEAVTRIRRSKLPDPAKIPNAGSFFKNPVVLQTTYQNLQKRFSDIPGYTVDENYVKIPAGWLIEQSGWKGKRIGNAGVHEKQSLVLVNMGGASGPDILRLSKKIAESVHQKFEIDLEPEVNII